MLLQFKNSLVLSLYLKCYKEDKDPGLGVVKNAVTVGILHVCSRKEKDHPQFIGFLTRD